MTGADHEARLARIENDIAQILTKLDVLMTAHNMGRGFWFTAKVGAGIVAALAALATVWKYVAGHP